MRDELDETREPGCGSEHDTSAYIVTEANVRFLSGQAAAYGSRWCASSSPTGGMDSSRLNFKSLRRKLRIAEG